LENTEKEKIKSKFQAWNAWKMQESKKLDLADAEIL